jgi:hypothetical protein
MMPIIININEIVLTTAITATIAVLRVLPPLLLLPEVDDGSVAGKISDADVTVYPLFVTAALLAAAIVCATSLLRG